MRTLLITSLLALACLMAAPAYPQDPQVTGDRDGSSQQVEESDEAYRRRMELEDARNRPPTYTDPGGGYQREPEKIDKLPPESRENIRDQLVDIIMENPDWEPSDALQEYPYEPTAAAQADPSLLQQEQEAWDEQIEKYHAREAEAFGAYRGPVAGPGNPDGAEGGQQGQSGEQGQGGSGQQGGQQGGQAGSQGQAGTYQPYQPSDESAEDAVSTAGVSESALDFLKAQRAPATGSTAAPPSDSAGQAQQPNEASAPQAEQSVSQSQSQSLSESDEAADETDRRGIIAIEDLDKLEGAGGVPVAAPPREEEEEEKEGGGG